MPYQVIHQPGQLPEPDRRGAHKRKPAETAEPVVKIDPHHETDAHGWPTDDAIRKATEKVTK